MRKIKPKTEKYMTDKVGPAKETKPIYPTMRIDLEHLPEAKKWGLGKEYGLELKVKLVGLSQSRFDNSAEFEMHEVGTEGMEEKGEHKE